MNYVNQYGLEAREVTRKVFFALSIFPQVRNPVYMNPYTNVSARHSLAAGIGLVCVEPTNDPIADGEAKNCDT